MIKKLLRDEPATLAEFESAIIGKKHVHRPDTDNISIKPEHGTSKAYTLRRLKRESPELYQEVCDGTLSANAAAIKAGFRKEPTAIDLLKRAWKKATESERKQFRKFINASI
jgi:hypothetical protein